MKLRVLTDNNTYIDRYYLAEPGLCFYIETEGKKILFDTGFSDVFIKNAHSIGVDLSGLDAVVISHSHVDHTGGLGPLSRTIDTSRLSLYANRDSFIPRKVSNENIGAFLSEEQLRQLYDVKFTDKPVYITPRLLYMGPIPRRTEFEPPVALGEMLIDGKYVPDYNMDDSAMVFIGDEGLFIITGCSHAGICNMTEYARELTGIDKIAGIIGGFHLFDVDERLERTIDYLESCNIPSLNPCHCVSLHARAEMIKRLRINEVAVGMELEAK